jgi:signal transduction histidine kinase
VLQRFPIRLKLAIALAVPLVALLVVAVFEAVQTGRERNDIRRQADLAEAALGPGSLLSKLEDERNAAAIELLGVENLLDLPVEDQPTARAATDAARAEFEQDLARLDAETRETYAPAIEGLGQLEELRAQVDGFSGPRDIQSVNDEETRANFDGYSSIMTRLFDANRQVALEIDDPDLRRGAQLIDLSARQSDLHAKLAQLLVLAAASRDGVNTSTEIASISALRSELTDNERSIRTKAAGAYQPLVDTLLGTDHIQRFPQLVDEALSSPQGQVNAAEVLATADGPSAEEFGYTVFRDAVAKELRAETDDKTGAADTRVWLFRSLALAAILVAGVATWAVSRSITRPLRALTRQATDMANNRLPDAVLDILDTPLGDDVTVPNVDPIAVQTRDEVSDVAEALNTVQDSALDLAVEQAVLRRNIADSFVNLGRRNQNLLGRQLDFITELEHNETDPDTLANLFRLDHLATRMRRNAESLLVLAGIDPPRKWTAPVRVTDAIRAALGEVEDYQRVTVRAVEPTTVLGTAAADLAHLLAELIENALIFSPPDQTVEIRGRVQPAGYTLAVIDSGLGMPPEELARANRRLAGAESFTIAPSKYLGHYVAGNLAARHGINVTLHNSPGHGITATVNLPPNLLTTEPTGLPEGGAGPALQSPPAALPPAEPAGVGGGMSAFDAYALGQPGPAAPVLELPPPGGPNGPGGPGGMAPMAPAAHAAPAPVEPPAIPDEPLFPQVPAITGQHDLRHDALPPRLPPSGQVGQVTNPMPALDLSRPPAQAPGQVPARPQQPEELPQLSAPHLRVSSTPTSPGGLPAIGPNGPNGPGAPAAPIGPMNRGVPTGPGAPLVPNMPPAAPAAPAAPPANGPSPTVAAAAQLLNQPNGPNGPGAPPLPQRGGPRPSSPGPDRTPGGLVKRSPRPNAEPEQPPALRPSEDLLQTLATYTTQLHRQVNPARPPTPPGGSAFPAFNPTPHTGTPAVRPGFPPATGPVPAQPQPHATPTMHSGTTGTAPEHTASGLARRVRGAQLPQTQPIGLRRTSPPAAATPTGQGAPGAGAAPATFGGRAPAPSGQAGAPLAQPVDNRHHAASRDDGAAAGGVGSSDAQTRSAKDVYSFLSSFSAGVQRGLDEARGDSTTSEEDK